MAGELSLFYISTLLSTTTVTGGVSITTSEDITDSWYSTQALATAAAVAAGVLFHANNGAVAVPANGWEKGWIRNRDDGTWRQLEVSDLDELGQRKYAARVLHGALLVWEAGVRDVEHEKPIIDVHRALDFLCFGHWANYVVFKSTRNGTWTAAQQIAWAYKMTEGAADITTVQEFFQHAHTIEDYEVPQEACAWVNPNDAVPVVTRAEARNKSTQDTTNTTVVRRRRNRLDND